ncbi:MAG: hypothetical protein ACR2PI_13580, partial [Hyphomicrobiaceae bacterium]
GANDDGHQCRLAGKTSPEVGGGLIPNRYVDLALLIVSLIDGWSETRVVSAELRWKRVLISRFNVA